jgi:RNA polymerase-binding transcription factor DksA
MVTNRLMGRNVLVAGLAASALRSVKAEPCPRRNNYLEDACASGAVMTTLTAEQTSQLAALLNQREQQLGAEIEAAREATRQRDGQRAHEVIDRKEDATDEASMEVAQAETERDIAELKAVQAAKLRLNAGLYGQCVDCEEPIAVPRLLAQPAAMRCAACQTGYEERLAHKH